MSKEHESFIHFDRCIERLNSAWKTLNLVKDSPGHPLVGPAFRFALVEYAAPYTSSEGVITKKLKGLESSYVPSEFRPLHNRLIEARHKVHAHTDLNILDAKLSVFEFQGERLTTTSLNNIHGLEELENIDQIIRLIEVTLSNLYADRDRRKNAL